MRGEAMSLLESAMLLAPSSDHSAKPLEMPIGSEEKVREDTDGAQTSGRQRLEEGVIAGQQIRVVE